MQQPIREGTDTAGTDTAGADTAGADTAGRRRVGEVVGSVVLNVASIGGVLCIVLVVLAFFFNITLIMFKTGSMSPTIPAGSVAIVREIAASEAKVGDVVTVDRTGALPITHRVVDVSPDSSGSSNARSLTLKGDANEATDAAPYSVEKVRIVLASLPGVAAFVVWLSNPLILGAVTVGAAAVVTWAFWPRNTRRAPNPEPRDRAAPSAHGRRRATTSAVASHLTGSSLALLIAACAFGAVVADPPPAAAAPNEQETGTAQLRLLSIGDPIAMSNLLPGVPVQWQLGAWVESPDPGTVQLSLGGTGSAALELRAIVRSCDQRWVDGVCASGATELMASHALSVNDQQAALTEFASSTERWLLFEIWMPSTRSGEAAPPGASVQLTVYASGLGEQLSAVPGSIGQLPTTGVSPFAAVFTALSAVCVGLLLAALAHLSRWRSSARGVHARSVRYVRGAVA